MKKTISALLIFATMALSAPKKAEAGFMVVAATQEFVWKHKYETLDTVLVIALPVSMITFGCFMVLPHNNPLNYGSLVSGIILLGETLESRKSDVEKTLVARYAGLSDSPLAVSRLADEIISTYKTAALEDGVANVKIPAEKTLEIVNSSNLDLTPAQQAELTSTLSK